MKLLVADSGSWKRYVSREFHYIMADLITYHGWKPIETFTLLDGHGSLKTTLIDKFGKLPDRILFWECFDLLTQRREEVACLGCPKFIFADDLHGWHDAMRPRNLVSFALFETILSTYAYTWNEFYPEFCGTKKLVWIPHSASPDFMLDYNPQPENSIFLSGSISPSYPLRQEMEKLYEQGSYAITCQSHPGYHSYYNYDSDPTVGRQFAETIHKHRAAFTDSSRYRYVVAKYFEIPATGTLLFADEAVSGPLNDLGFRANEHYISVSQKNLQEQIRYVLDEKNHDEVDAIRLRAQELVWRRHKTSDRARQIEEACAA